MTDNSILNMVGGEKHINPHYDIKEESANKGFTGIEVNGVRFSNIQEMLVYMDKQRNEIILLKKENAELEKQISILLSCNNCPDNKGGYICQKEYEDKCLAQKIQYIKELQEENKKWKDEWQEQVQKANDEGYARTLQTIQLNKAKEIIRALLFHLNKDTFAVIYETKKESIEKAEDFLKE